MTHGTSSRPNSSTSQLTILLATGAWPAAADGSPMGLVCGKRAAERRAPQRHAPVCPARDMGVRSGHTGLVGPFRRRILVVEDEALMGALLLQVLDAAGFDARIAPDVIDARRAVVEFDPDAALLDISLGEGPSGLDLAHVLRRQYPHIALIFLTKHPDLRTAGVGVDQVPEGCGFLRKDMISDSRYLIDAIDAVLVDEPRDYRHDLSPDRPLSQLTAGQMEVLRLAAQGLTNGAIARARGVSERAVERSLQLIFGHLGIEAKGDLNPRVEAVRHYVQAAGLPARPR
ncbi:MAG: response regulator transcription factor [Actinobacteria bacterium]|nr:MAG: response regulator transcription factor [Actinomycetota bacterium]